MDRSNLAWTLMTAALLGLAGCGSPTGPSGGPGPVYRASVDKARVLQAAQEVLGHMRFSIEKIDLESGILMTRPLPGGQFFEVWRSDNVGAFSHAEGNLQSLRRIVELSVAQQADRVRIDCRVRVHRLNVPNREVVSSAQGYRAVTESAARFQSLRLSQDQESSLEWTDLGDDPGLAKRILDRIEALLLKDDGAGDHGHASGVHKEQQAKRADP